MKTVYLHIGTHKTGSTSIQRWLAEHERHLLGHGYALYKGLHSARNHVELYLASMRADRNSFGRQAMRNLVIDDAYINTIRNRVRDFIEDSPVANVVFTSEGLSLLRHEDELRVLAGMFSGCRVRTILVLRDKVDFLSSYRRQLLGKPGRLPDSSYWSALYVEDDTWLTDYAQLIEAYEAEFRHGAVRTIDYDVWCGEQGNILPPFLEALGLDVTGFEPESFRSYRENAQVPALARGEVNVLLHNRATAKNKGSCRKA